MRRMSSVTLLTATFKININSNGYPNFVIIGTKMIKSKTNAGVSVLPLFSPTVMSTSETLVVLLLHLWLISATWLLWVHFNLILVVRQLVLQEQGKLNQQKILQRLWPNNASSSIALTIWTILWSLNSSKVLPLQVPGVVSTSSIVSTLKYFLLLHNSCSNFSVQRQDLIQR